MQVDVFLALSDTPERVSPGVGRTNEIKNRR